MSYQTCLDCNWKDGVHDVRAHHWQHPWLVIHRDSRTAAGYFTREEARRVYQGLREISEPTDEELAAMEYAEAALAAARGE